MKIEEFTKQVEELQNFFKPKERLSDNDKQIWYSKLKNMSIERFKYICSQFYGETGYMPRLNEILEKNRTLGIAETNKKKFIDCPKCKNRGGIQYWKDVENGNKIIKYPFYALCDYCNRDKQTKDPKHHIPTIKELGL